MFDKWEVVTGVLCGVLVDYGEDGVWDILYDMLEAKAHESGVELDMLPVKADEVMDEYLAFVKFLEGGGTIQMVSP